MAHGTLHFSSHHPHSSNAVRTDGVSSTSCGLDVILCTITVTMTFNCYTLIGINYFNSCLKGPYWGIHLESTWSTSMSAVHRKRRRNQRRRRATGRCRWEKWIRWNTWNSWNNQIFRLETSSNGFDFGFYGESYQHDYWIRTILSEISIKSQVKLRLWDVIGPSPRRCIIWSVRDLGRAEAGYNPRCYWTGESIRPIPSRCTILGFQWFVLIGLTSLKLHIYIHTQLLLIYGGLGLAVSHIYQTSLCLTATIWWYDDVA